jgi:probable HAF family extracellular repeat protein
MNQTRQMIRPLSLNPNRRLCSLLIYVAVLHAPSLAASFTPLGYLPGGGRVSSAEGISADGKFVVGASGSSAAGLEAFRWSAATGMQGLGDLPTGNFYSEARAVSNDGNVVVGLGTATDSSSLSDGFRWTAAGGIQPIGHLVNPNDSFQFSYALAVSADGTTVAGESRSAAGNEAFRWNVVDGISGLGDLPGGFFDSYATAISADASVIVGFSESAPYRDEAFRWTAATGMVGLGFMSPSPNYSLASGVSADGKVIVGFANSAAFRWTAATGMVPLPNLPLGQRVSPMDVSADGSVIVGNSESDNSGNSVPAFIWTASGGTQFLSDYVATHFGLSLNDWILDEANGISDDGRFIVGRAVNSSSGDIVAYVLDLSVPEPSAAVLFGLMSAAIVLCRCPRFASPVLNGVKPRPLRWTDSAIEFC